MNKAKTLRTPIVHFKSIIKKDHGNISLLNITEGLMKSFKDKIDPAIDVTRAGNTIKIAHLLTIPEDDLLEFEGIGLKTAANLRSALSELGLKIGELEPCKKILNRNFPTIEEHIEETKAPKAPKAEKLKLLNCKIKIEIEPTETPQCSAGSLFKL